MKVEKRQKVQGISQKYAAYRASFISNVHYNLSFKLEDKNTEFFGEVEIHFDLKSQKPLTIDFLDGNVQKLFMNGKEVSQIAYEKYFIEIPSMDLKRGKNKIKISFSHPYNKSGKGLYRFQDPQDGRVYLYSDFEPYDTNLMFPCFDQPDLKATYTLTVDAPKDWVVVSATLENKKETVSKDLTRWFFPKTKPFSTYIFSMHAGPYQIWESKAGNIPLRLMARASFAKYVPVKEWFTITQQGFGFFQKYFKCKYAFSKYDQIIVADFNSGAMENVGAVTFNEAYIPRAEATEKQRETLAEVILHEMAHMWFGNLVTMRWWNDLWLNESFATYMSILAIDNATEFKRVWQSFYSDIKQWAYWEDGLVTTHPIFGDVQDTETAFINFDGITYGKGASCLKQIAYYLGPKMFQKGVQNYFKRYAYKNTELKDFISELGKAAGKNLNAWTKLWLKTDSPNTIEIDRKKKILLQKKTGGKQNTLRPHKTLIGCYKLKNNKIVLDASFPLTYEKDKTSLLKYEAYLNADMIYPNTDDHDYVKIKLDSKTLETAQGHLGKISDPFTRLMFWQSLWDMVRDTELPLPEFQKLLFNHLKKEDNIYVANSIVKRFFDSFIYMPQTQEKTAFLDQAQSFLWGALQSAKPGSDFQKLYFDEYIKFSESPTVQEKVLSFLEGKLTLSGFVLDQDRRWKIISQLHKHNYAGSESLREKELKKDPSENGQKSALACEVLQPVLDIKQKWFQKVTDGKSDLSLARTKTVMTHLFPSNQDHLHKEFSSAFFENLLKLSKTKENEYLSAYTASLAPTLHTDESVKTLALFIQKQAKKLPPVVVKRLKVAHQEDERALKIKKRVQSYFA
ncbi:MAG: aminopeptidase N [Deltaproteobacteria bacterium RIFCSPHIGHO2_02_FULL_40_11]|nr:MAG: aminopeptidase N [Deltaproteobacteria bacterium RIFCSPHIGHO2_02_FULL_40_11]